LSRRFRTVAKRLIELRYEYIDALLENDLERLKKVVRETEKQIKILREVMRNNKV